jgi:hypothetical protein
MEVNMLESGATIKWRVLGHAGIKTAMSIQDSIKGAVVMAKDSATLPMETIMRESGMKMRLRDMEDTITITDMFMRDGLSRDTVMEWASINMIVEFWIFTSMKMMREWEKAFGGVATEKRHGEPTMV